MQARLLVDSIEESRLLALLGEQRSGQVKLETLGNLVVEFDLGLEDIRGCPSLGENKTVLEVGVFGLNITGDGRALLLAASNFESHTGRGLGLDLERGSVEWVVLSKEVIGGLAKILRAMKHQQVYGIQ